MAKIAGITERPDVVISTPEARLLGAGNGWSVSDIVCSAGPHDQPYEECHARPSIAFVISGTFQYHGRSGCEMMTPGSVLLGNPGECFRCGHEHGTGDRCVAFFYDLEFFDRLAHDAGGSRMHFRAPRLAPDRVLSPLTAKAGAVLAGDDRISVEELSALVAAKVTQWDGGVTETRDSVKASDLARVTKVVRVMDHDPESPAGLEALAQLSGLSPFHFLRAFANLTGVTPHQYLLRLRLRSAAIRLRVEPTKILDIALSCGFTDISNFNHAFRAEFGMSPRAYRSHA